MKLQKPLLALGFLGLGALLLNVHSYASNSYYLMSCTEQNIPTGYYASIDTTQDEATFRQTLHDVISANYVKNSYDAAWNIDYYADADPYNEGHVQCLYTGLSIENGSHVSSADKLYWNREHTWPKSHGFSDSSCAAYSDCHHLRAAEAKLNIGKSNNDFGELDSDYTESYGNKYGNGVFEPNDSIKGDVARMLLYMMIRYGEYDDTTMSYKVKVLDEEGNVVQENGKDKTETLTEKLDLILVDDSNTTAISNGNGRLAKLSTILAWHYQDPVSDREIYRNNVVYMFQRNRNPFIDHPEYVEYAFQGSGSYQGTDPADPVLPDTEVRTEEFLVDSTGFEAEEGFVGTKDTKDYYKQYSHTTNLPWSGYQAVASTVSAISGSQSMRLTVAKETAQQAQFFMTEDVYNLSRITFKAKGDKSGNVLHVMYSVDSGLSWHEGESYNLTTSAKTYSFELSANGGYDKARIGFFFERIYSGGLSYVNIDDLNVYRYKTNAPTEFTRETTKSSLKYNYFNNYYEEEDVYYEKVTSLDDLAVGNQIIIGSLEENYTMGAAKSSNYNVVELEAENGIIDNPLTSTIITIAAGATEGTISLKVGNKYLGNENTEKTGLKACDTLTNKTSFNVSINSTTNAIAFVILDSGVNSNQIGFNSTNKLFNCYTADSSTRKDIVAYVKRVGTVTKVDIEISNMNIRFGTIIDKELYDSLLELDSNATFGVALSKDGVEFTKYDCNPAVVLYEAGVTTQDPNGNFVQWAAVIPVSSDKFDVVIYAKAYVTINGVDYYTNGTSYSVRELANYYKNNASSLVIEGEDLVSFGGIIE